MKKNQEFYKHLHQKIFEITPKSPFRAISFQKLRFNSLIKILK